ncbi:MAG: hypothetical protein HY719_02445 [Planctomycetes bacterium]|nr:hypothetical protein [Planctomycetota bacterium]
MMSSQFSSKRLAQKAIHEKKITALPAQGTRSCRRFEGFARCTRVSLLLLGLWVTLCSVWGCSGPSLSKREAAEARIRDIPVWSKKEAQRFGVAIRSIESHEQLMVDGQPLLDDQNKPKFGTAVRYQYYLQLSQVVEALRKKFQDKPSNEPVSVEIRISSMIVPDDGLGGDR